MSDITIYLTGLCSELKVAVAEYNTAVDDYNNSHPGDSLLGHYRAGTICLNEAYIEWLREQTIKLRDKKPVAY